MDEALRALQTVQPIHLGCSPPITQAIKMSSVWARYAEGVQTPTEPMQLKGGTCRGFALLMIDAVRVLGLAARL
jgi:hypothetical protein